MGGQPSTRWASEHRGWDIGRPGYDGRVPIYEFRCEACGERFEGLVAAGTESLPCPGCGAERTGRVFSAQATPFQLVQGPGDARRQEARNAQLRERTKKDWKGRRQRARRTAGGSDG
jgi:putative FmdB family regulatory protein